MFQTNWTEFQTDCVCNQCRTTMMAADGTQNRICKFKQFFFFYFPQNLKFYLTILNKNLIYIKYYA